MTLQELLNQRFQNTAYVYPEAGKPFIPKSIEIYNKSLEIAKTIYDLYFKYSLKLLEDLYGSFSFITFMEENIDLYKELNEVEELIPFFQTILDKNVELIEIITNDKIIIENQNIPFVDFQQNVKQQVGLFSQTILKRLSQLQTDRYIPMHFNVFVEIDFNKYYFTFEQYLYQKYHYYKILIECQNLALEQDCEINLNDRIKIKWLNDIEWHAFLNRPKDTHSNRFQGNIENPILEISLKAHKNKGYNMKTDSEGSKGVFVHSESMLDSLIYDIISVLRLNSTNYVGFQRVFSISAGINSFYFEHFMSYLYSNTLVRGNDKYLLNNENKKDLIDLFKKYEDSKINKSISSAIRRFNFTYERIADEDKLIDYFIAIEALLNIEGKRKHVQLSNKISELLGQNDIEKRNIRKKIVKYYDLRNDIIHDPNKDRKVLIIESVTYMENITRKLILNNFK